VFLKTELSRNSESTLSGVRAIRSDISSTKPIMESKGGILNISDVNLLTNSGLLIKMEGLNKAFINLSNLITMDENESDVIHADLIENGLEIISSRLSNNSGNLLKTATAVETIWQNVAANAPQNKSIYFNEGATVGKFSYANTGFNGTSKVTKAIISALSTLPSAS
jgi:hypothetical protein